MTTPYQCKGCMAVFNGTDPIYFGAFPVPVYPDCPNNPTANSAIGNIDELTKNKLAHPVSLAILPVPVPVPVPVVEAKPVVAKPAWGNGALVLKPETAEEKRLREVADALKREAKKREDDERVAQNEAAKLVNHMVLAFAQGGGGVSANFPMDKEYGAKDSGKQVTMSTDIIQRASVLWLLKGADYAFRPPAWKAQWKQHQANFEKLIETGNADRGKHNFHVVRA
jgi:hypothetical protein